MSYLLRLFELEKQEAVNHAVEEALKGLEQERQIEKVEIGRILLRENVPVQVLYECGLTEKEIKLLKKEK